MGSVHIPPVIFLVKRLEQFFVSDKSFSVRDQSKLIRSVPQHIDEKAAQALCFNLLMSFAQDNPLPLSRSWTGASHQIICSPGKITIKRVFLFIDPIRFSEKTISESVTPDYGAANRVSTEKHPAHSGSKV